MPFRENPLDGVGQRFAGSLFRFFKINHIPDFAEHGRYGDAPAYRSIALSGLFRFARYKGAAVSALDPHRSKFSSAHTGIEQHQQRVYAEPKDYNVEIVPNAQRDFDFTVDSERYLYSKQGDMTAAFGLKKSDTYFELVIPKDFSLEYALQSCYPGKEVVVPEEAADANACPYMLVISSYNDSVVYHIALSVGAEVMGVTLDPDHIIFTG